MSTAKLKVGDKVMFSREFLRSTSQLTGPTAHAVGSVLKVRPVTSARDLIDVQWDGEDEPSKVISSNLVKQDLVHLEPV